jgi:dihydroflavonol-4-reductase
MQTLVTGGSGFIGQHLVAALVNQGRRVRILDTRPPTTAPAGVHFIQGSILDPVLVREALDDVDDVYHLAALPGMWMPNKNDFRAVNCCGTQVVIAAARERGVSRFLHCSTESILFGASNNEAILTEEVRTTPDEMPGAYTRSKLAAEQLAMQVATSEFPVPTEEISHHRWRCCAIFSAGVLKSTSISS